MLDKNAFAVKEQAKMFSSRKAYDIHDAQTSELLATALQKTSGLMSLVGMAVGKHKIPVTIEVRSKADNSLLFSVRRRGLLAKKIEAVDAQGKVIATFKSKRFSLAGGFHVYDGAGKHFAEIKGKLLKAEYKFLTPGGSEMGTVSKKWGGMSRELLSSASTYGVQINENFVDNQNAKLLILAAAIAIDALFASGGGKTTGKAAANNDDE